MKSTILISLGGMLSVAAQDPAEGWMAYAVGEVPSGTERITKMQMTWTVGEKPRESNAFFSPWFGMDPIDNLNLIQPVNPWLGTNWAMYTEYFQWSPEDNSNSQQMQVESGQTLQGTLTYEQTKDSYFLNQTVIETGQSSTQTVKCQNGKKYVLPYVVYEKTFPCGVCLCCCIFFFSFLRIQVYNRCDAVNCKLTVYTTLTYLIYILLSFSLSFFLSFFLSLFL